MLKQQKDVRHVRFGRALSSARDKTGMTQAVLGRAIGRSDSHISNVEGGYRRMSATDVRAADEKLGANGRLVRLYDDLYEDGPTDWLDNLVELQAEAEIIREWHPVLVPGLLQTEDYARAVVSAGAPWRTPESVTDKVEQRMRASARVLDGPTPHYHVVIDDSVITRPVGSPAIMASQLRSLVERVRSGRVMIQTYPFASWPHAGLSGPFSLLSSASAPDTVHVESVYRGQATDDPETVRHTGMSFSTLQANARGTRETVEHLCAMIEEHEQHV
ncbi:helix-turn-helix domain-containing protein [Streptomonospora sp. S1-112]|uniref:Helix-turn-helix domain-containing protein n=1 Tax=Streptomonospora mangrovi TaxID=2883123 RepID=A0A9X3NQX0_9ACTN|nr:helix-turn-helix transcriptional regulator [Streptomonospora mangrovi]MDA0567893.1 helix-turn-helix domain-containing protein [Streptomonospora mangrovi]